jgi:DNA-binding transcriptional ArsR family regulator
MQPTEDSRSGSTPRDIQRILAALSSPVRRDILSLVWDQELPAGEIASAFSVTKPTISQHLGVLREAGLVTARVAGTSRRYRARREQLGGLRGALEGPGKWSNADDVPERALAEARTAGVVIAATDVRTDQLTTFAGFTDPVIYSAWLGVPVTIEDGRFECTMEWGTQVRGRYDLVCPPELIVMRWDFAHGTVPVPGGEMTGYLRVRPRGKGARVEVHQLVDSPAQASFMEAAWKMVLGRLAAGIEAASGGGPMRRRSRRAKNRASA